MFDKEELEELREDRYKWQGHVNREVRTERSTRFSGGRFFSSVGASLVLSVVLVAAIVSSNGALALIGVTGIGGFGASISELDGADVEIYPAIGPTAACPSPITGGDFAEGGGEDGGPVLEDDSTWVEDEAVTLPQLKADISDANISEGEEIDLWKDIPLPDLTNLEMIRINLGQQDDATQGDIYLGDASFTVTALEADSLTAFNTEIKESFSDGTAENPRLGSTGEFTVSGEAEGEDNRVVLEGAMARAHFLSFEVLEMPNLELDIDYYETMPDDNVTADIDCPEP